MSSHGLEQRLSPRVSLFQEIVCEASGARQARSQTADLSEGGMFVDLSSPPFAVGEALYVCFCLGPGGPRIVATAEVLYVQPGLGMGLRFLELSDAEREGIAGYVERVRSRPVMRGEFHLRKSSRVSISVPVRVRAPRPEPAVLDERAQIITLSKHGACLLLRGSTDVGSRLTLETANGREFQTSVVWVGDARSSQGQVGVQCRGLAQSLGFHFP